MKGLGWTPLWMALATCLITPNAHADSWNRDSSWCDGVDVGAHFIFWKPCFDDLDYAYITDTSGSRAINEYKYVSNEWKPGLQVTLAKQGLFCDWNFSASYTRITGSNSNGSALGSNGTLTPTAAIVGISGPYESAQAYHRFSYNAYDLLFSRRCCITSCHTLTPFVGVAGLVHNQHLETQYSTPTDRLTINWDGDYNGVGFRFGTQYDLTWNDCWMLFVKGSGAILVGTLSNKQKEDALAITPEQWEDETCNFVPGTQIAVGFSYDTCWCDKLFKFVIGYEFLQWYNLSTPRRQEVWSINKGTAGYHGLNVGLNITF